MTPTPTVPMPMMFARVMTMMRPTAAAISVPMVVMTVVPRCFVVAVVKLVPLRSAAAMDVITPMSFVSVRASPPSSRAPP